jgi:hypothetical protein
MFRFACLCGDSSPFRSRKVSAGPLVMTLTPLLERAHLIAISPKEILCSDVLIRIFNPLFQRRHMAPVLPMLIP